MSKYAYFEKFLSFFRKTGEDAWFSISLTLIFHLQHPRKKLETDFTVLYAKLIWYAGISEWNSVFNLLNAELYSIQYRKSKNSGGPKEAYAFGEENDLFTINNLQRLLNQSIPKKHVLNV